MTTMVYDRRQVKHITLAGKNPKDRRFPGNTQMSRKQLRTLFVSAIVIFLREYMESWINVRALSSHITD